MFLNINPDRGFILDVEVAGFCFFVFLHTMVSHRFFIRFDFNGTGFHGWQVQPNALTVQQEMEDALSLLLGERLQLTGAGRTDTGVHARNYIAHFETENGIEGKELSSLMSKLNRFLPPSILIKEVFEVKPDVHARFSALSRTYRYYISRSKNPFSTEFSWIYTGSLDVRAMGEAAGILPEYHDFRCFSKTRTQTRTTECEVFESFFTEKDEMLIYHVRANRFLRNMVRAIVGTLMEVGKGKLDITGFRNVIENGNRSDAGVSVPARGLFLEQIEYPEDIRLLP